MCTYVYIYVWNSEPLSPFPLVFAYMYVYIHVHKLKKISQHIHSANVTGPVYIPPPKKKKHLPHLTLSPLACVFKTGTDL